MSTTLPSHHQYRDSHFKDKTVWRPYHLYNANTHNIHVCSRWRPTRHGCASILHSLILKCRDITWNVFKQATGLDAWASRVKCPARFVSHLLEICIYIWVVYSLCFFCCLFITVTWWYVWCFEWASGDSRGSTGMFGNLMAIYHIMLQFIQNHSRFVMLMIWK